MPPKKKKATAKLTPFEEIFALLKDREDVDVDDRVYTVIEENPDISINQLYKVGSTQQTILKYALMNPNVTTHLLKYLVDKGADVNLPEPMYTSPLEIAIDYTLEKPKVFNSGEGEENMLRFLLTNGAKIETISTSCKLFYESKSKKPIVLSIVRRLFEKYPDLATKSLYNRYRPERLSVFLYEIARGGADFAVTKYLIDNGADPKIRHPNGGSTLLHKLVSSATKEQLQYLIAKGCDVNEVDDFGNTMLHFSLPYGIYYINDDSIARVQIAIELGADVAKKNSAGNTPLALYTLRLASTDIQIISKEMIEQKGRILDLLIEAGASVDETVNLEQELRLGEGHLRVLNGATVAQVIIATFNRVSHMPETHAFIAKIIDKVADPNKLNSQNLGVLSYLIYSSSLYPDEFISRMLTKLLEKGLNINNVMPNGYTYLGQIVRPSRLKLLIDAGADVNAGTEPLLLGLYKMATMDMLTLLLDNPAYDYNKLFNGKRADIIIFDYAENQVAFGRPQPQLKLKLIRDKFAEKAGPVKNNSPLWEGWTSADAEKFDTVFDGDAASEVTLCPICLKTVAREDGCVYIQGHNCANLSGFYHKRLYDLYKNDIGIITWCTICNRIAKGHRHYNLGFSDGDIPQLLIGHDPFTKDCSRTEGGGGLKEKFLRFRRLREHARDMMEDVGKVTEKQALEELVEEMWNAPLQRKRGTNLMYVEKRFNFPSTNFPAPPKAKSAIANNKPVNFNSLPNIPNQNAARPPTTLAGINSIMRMEEPVVIQFHHVQPDGSINNHEGNYISPESLEMFIDGQIKKHKTDEFGFCWAYPGDCKGRLHPDEIKPFISEELYKDYKGKFNWKFGPRQGGSHTRKLVKHRHSLTRKFKGGAPHNIFVPATNAQCYLPPRRNNTIHRNNSTKKNNRNNS